MKLSDVIDALPAKASRITNSEALDIFNFRLMEDLLPGLFSTFPTSFEAVQEIEIDTDVSTTYALNTDFREHIGMMDQNRDMVFEGILNSLDQDRDLVQFVDDNVVVDVKTRVSKLIIEYYKQPVLLTDVGDDLPFATNVERRIFSILVQGLAIFYYAEKKKVIDLKLLSPTYENLKTNVFQNSVITT